MDRTQIFGLYLRHIFLLSLAGSLLGLLLGLFFVPLINFFITSLLPFTLPSLLHPRAILISLSIGILGVVLLSYPLILGAIRQRAACLFQEVAEIGRAKNPSKGWLHFIICGLFFVLMSFYCSQSFRVGGIFLLLFLGAALLAFLLGLFLLKTLKYAVERVSLTTKLSLRYLQRYWLSSLFSFLKFSLRLYAFKFYSPLRGISRSAIKHRGEFFAAQFFLFDIQDEQRTPLKTF